nr:protein archease-like [Aotus nancymaae]
MAHEKGDIRDYNLTEEQKAIKAKYPPVKRNYKYLDHTADIQLHAWRDSREEAFEQCPVTMFGYTTNTGTVEPLQTAEVETQGVFSFLFHFSDEKLYTSNKFQITINWVERRIFIVQALSGNRSQSYNIFSNAGL